MITAAVSLADVPGTVRLWHQRRTEFSLSLAAFLAVALLGVLPGIAWPSACRSSTCSAAPGGRTRPSSGTSRTCRVTTTSAPTRPPSSLPGLVVYRFDAPLIFANAPTFRDEIRRLAAADPPPRWILVAAEPMTDVDTTAADLLEDLDEELNARGVSLVFAEMKDPVRRKIERYELTRTIDPTHFFPTVEAGVAAYRTAFATDQRTVRDIPQQPAPRRGGGT